jgi:ABC-type branched-subunit amino acid transport system substrate-binding protein
MRMTFGSSSFTKTALPLFFTLCFCTDGQAKDGVYRIGFVGALSGPAASNGDGGLQGATVALDEINEANKAGRKFEMIVVDDATDPKTAGDVCSRLALQDKVDIVVGIESTPARVVCNQLAERAGIPYISASNAPGDLCLPNIVSVGNVSNQMTNPLIDYVLKKGLRRFYFIGSDYSAARAGEKLAESHIKAAGGEMVGVAYVPLGASDLSAELGKIAAAKPDVVIDIIVGDEVLTFHKQFANDPRLAGIKRADNFVRPRDLQLLGAAGEGIMVAAPYFPEIESVASDKFKAALKKKYGEKAKPDHWSMFGYDALHMIANAVDKVGPNPRDVLAEMKQASFDGPGGSLSIESNYAKLPMFIGEADASGAVKIAEQTPPLAPALACQFK